MKTKISFEMGQLALASLVVTLFLVFMYFLIIYPSEILSEKTVMHLLIAWSGFVSANLAREYLKLTKKVAAEIAEEKRLIDEKNEIEKVAKKTRINLLRPIPATRRNDVLFIAKLYNSSQLAQLDSYFKFDRILEFPIYKFISISEAKKQAIFNEELASVLKMYRNLYSDCSNDKTLKIIVKNIVETKELIARLEEDHYQGSKTLLNTFNEYLRKTLEDIGEKDLFDFDILKRAKIQELTGE